MVASFELAGHVVGIMVDRNVTREYLDEIHQIILSKIEVHGKINLFCEIERGQNVSLKMILKDLNFKYKNSSNINKLAFVSDVAWMRSIMSFNDIILPCEIQTFDNAQRLEAMNWVSH